MTNPTGADAPISENQMEIKKLGVSIRLHNFPSLAVTGNAPEPDAPERIDTCYSCAICELSVFMACPECSKDKSLTVAPQFCQTHYIQHMEGAHGRTMHITLDAPRVAPNDDDLAFEAWWESLGLDGEDVRAREYDRHVLAKMAFIGGVNHEVSRTRADLAPKTEADAIFTEPSSTNIEALPDGFWKAEGWAFRKLLTEKVNEIIGAVNVAEFSAPVAPDVRERIYEAPDPHPGYDCGNTCVIHRPTPQDGETKERK